MRKFIALLAFLLCTAGAAKAQNYVAGSVTIAGPTNITNTTSSTSPTTGALVVTGGLGVGGNIYGNGNGITVTPSGTSAASLLPTILGRAANVLDYGAKCDGTTDDSAAIQSALNSGKGVVLISSGTCAIASTLTIPAATTLMLAPSTTLKWIGASGGVMLETSQTAVTNAAAVIGLGNAAANPNGLAGAIVRLDSGSGDTIENLTVSGNLASGGTVLDLHADIGSAPAGNLVGLNIRDILVTGQTGTCVRLTGAGGGTPITVVTDNNFYNVTCTDVTVKGVDFVQDADTNRFYGFYAQLDANNAVGLAFGSANFTAVEGVYENAFYGLAIDTFPNACSGSCTGRIGAVFGYSPNNTLEDFVQSPVAEGGVFTYTVAGVPEYIRYINAGSGSPDSYMRIYEGNSSVITAPITGVGNCTNLGSTGTCSLYTSSTSSSGIITLSPSGTGEGTNGVAELTFPVAAQGYSCTVSLVEGTDSWATGASVAYSGIDTTHINIVWNNNATALASSGTYLLSYYCRMNSTGWQ